MDSNVAKARSIFQSAVEDYPPDQWNDYLDGACRQDAALRRRVEGLLQAHQGEDSFLDRGEDGGGDLELDRPIAEGPGTVIGPYRILQQIGEGGFGVVFLAEQERPVRRRVALKVIKPGMDSREVIARFEAEQQALALMNHPNIAKVYDAGATETGHPYFVMELVQGVPITEYCDQCRLATRERLELFITVCQAVQHAHQKGVIHRDLKPNNVLVAMENGRPAPKIIDFGVAKAINQRLTERTLATGFAQMIGTPLYMSPEQAELSPLGVDTRSDIYSLGVLLYELLTRSTPFDKERLHSVSYDEMRRIIREEEPPRPSARISTLAADVATTSANRRRLDARRHSQDVRGELDWIVMKCLEKDRNRRYDTASGLEREIESYLHDEPVLACPPSAWYRFRKFARRRRGAMWTASVILLFVVVTAAASGGLIWRANQNLRQALGRERDALERERLNSYRQRIALADREWSANNLSGMETMLNECSEDLRGWEWHYLKRLRYSAPTPLRHDSAVLSAAFSPDGQLLATATQSGVLRLWEANTGQERRKWPAHRLNATSVVFSPDGRLLATGS